MTSLSVGYSSVDWFQEAPHPKGYRGTDSITVRRALLIGVPTAALLVLLFALMNYQSILYSSQFEPIGTPDLLLSAEEDRQHAFRPDGWLIVSSVSSSERTQRS